MTRSLLITAFIFLGLFSLHGQKSVHTKITFQIDTVRQGEGFRMFGSIPNCKDTAYLNFDGGFKGDTMSVIVDNKLTFTKILTSDLSTSYAETIAIPKTKKMIVTIKVNKQTFEYFKFNKDFCTTHLNYYDKKLSLTYTNQIMVYE